MTAQITPNIRQAIANTFGNSATFDVSLKEISRWKIGGIAQVVLTPKSVHELQSILSKVNGWQLPYVVIAGTSNLLFDSNGLDAIAIQIGSALSQVSIHNFEIVAEAGIWVPCLARKAMQAGFTGLEHTCGIPGTLGGLVYMNGGSQRKGIGDSVQFVETLDSSGGLHRYSREECGFAYRHSVFQSKDEIIIRVGLKLEKAKDKKAVHQEMLQILRDRSQKFPRRYPNCGSTFVSNPAMYAEFGPPGKVIEECGLKGLTYGGAQISPQHANFIVNSCNATTSDILYLIQTVRNRVYKKTGYLMEVEVKYVTKHSEIVDIKNI